MSRSKLDAELLIDASGKFPQGRQRVTREHGHMENEIWPGVFPGSPEHLKFCDFLLSKTKDNNGYALDGFLRGRAVSADLSLLFQWTGRMPSPIGSPAVQDKNLEQDSALLEMIGAVAKLYTRKFVPTPVPINKISSSGFPRFSNNPASKLEEALSTVSKIDKFCKLSKDILDGKANLHDLITDLNIYPVFFTTLRLQHTDKVEVFPEYSKGKVRNVFDWTGKTVTQNRSTPHPRLLAMRSRTPWAPAISYNIVAMFIGRGIGKYAKTEYAYTWYHTRENLERDVNNWPYVVGLDIGRFEYSVTPAMINAIFENFDCISPDIKNILKLFPHHPVFTRNDYPGQKGHRLIGDLGKFNNANFFGNPSGWGLTSEVAKIVGCAVELYLVRKVIPFNLSDLDNILKGKHPSFAIKNAGDDAVVCFRHRTDYDKFLDLVKRPDPCPPFDVQSENLVTFLGFQFWKESDKARLIAVNDINNMIVKKWVPERSIRHRTRRFFKYSWQMTLEEYSRHPLFSDYRLLHNEAFKHAYGVSFDTWSAMKITKGDMQEANALGADPQNLQDLIFLDNTDSIHYKIDVDEITPSLYDEFYVSLESERLTPLMEHVAM